jgi:hypothetical protein
MGMEHIRYCSIHHLCIEIGVSFVLFVSMPQPAKTKRALVAFLILLKSPWHGSVQGGHFAIFRPTKQNLLYLLKKYYWNVIIITIKDFN